MDDERSRALRLAYLFVSDWGHEFADVASGAVPSHRLFGAAELSARGHRVHHLSRRERAARRWSRPLDWRLAQALWVLRGARDLDVVVATHEAAALPALVLRRLGLLRRPVVVLTVAAVDACSGTGLRGRVYRWVLRGADALTVYASAQVDPLSALLGHRSPVRAIPLGVDTTFFSPLDVPRDGDLLAVGTNPGKDYPTLVRALAGDERCLIVTDPVNRAAAEPLAVGKAVRFDADVPIVRLRQLYASCRRLVLPLREAAFSSGQTVLLEGLAMGAPVVVSGVTGIRDYVVGAGPDVVGVVPPGDAEALAVALKTVPGWGPDAVAARRRHVIGRFDAVTMADAIQTCLMDVLARSGRPGNEHETNPPSSADEPGGGAD